MDRATETIFTSFAKIDFLRKTVITDVVSALLVRSFLRLEMEEVETSKELMLKYFICLILNILLCLRFIYRQILK